LHLHLIEYFSMLWLVGVQSGRVWTLYAKDDSLDSLRFLGPLTSSLVIVLSCHMNVVHIYGLGCTSYVLGDWRFTYPVLICDVE
jgi:hypothetical protein